MWNVLGALSSQHEASLADGDERVTHHPSLLPSAQIHESSPLDLASEEPERLPCLQRLLELGADVNAADKNGLCPFAPYMQS